MSVASLIDIIQSSPQDSWADRNKSAFEGLFGAQDGRYPKAASSTVKLRAPEMSSDSGVPFAAYIHPSNPDSGPYSGLSFVAFPVPGEPCLIGLVVGTQGLMPDEAILGRPGHARKVQAICAWLNQKYGGGSFVAWAKQDPTRTDISVPENVKQALPAYKNALDRYGGEMYALYAPTADRTGTDAATTAFLDLLFEERGYQPLANWRESSESVRDGWFEHLMPATDRNKVFELLQNRRYVIVQGPPGTGKTMMATEIIRDEYEGRGWSVQFHPNTTYENIIGGLAPTSTDGDLGLGFRFAPVRGFLMNAAAEALAQPSQNFLLHIDEINRADLGKVLGEAIFLLESTATTRREVTLPYDFGSPFNRTFYLPENVHILGTMNSADRSIAIVDIAVRRRFAFVSLWPRMSVVERHGCPLTLQAFKGLVSVFVEHATDDAFQLVPGHSYFLESDDIRARQSLRTNLCPLLEEYLAQGYISGFAEPVRGYLQWLRSL